MLGARPGTKEQSDQNGFESAKLKWNQISDLWINTRTIWLSNWGQRRSEANWVYGK